MSKGRKNWRQKLEKEQPSFVEDVKKMSAEEKKLYVVSLNKNLLEIEDWLKNDPQLNMLKEQLKDLMAPYQEEIKILKQKIRYLLEELKECGDTE